jgi:S-adenosylmethionine:tRNA ribosyltransferase-isomerase
VGPEAFDYVLPPEQIAQAPAAQRAQARLLRVGPPPLHTRVAQLPEHLPAGALVVLNHSKVVPARLTALRNDDRTFELLLSAPAAGQGPGTEVLAWVRGAKRLRPEDVLVVGDLALRYVGVDATDPRARRFVVHTGEVLAACRTHGEVPLPPYIARPGGPSADDRDRYQTVFAEPEGSVAAPTAGLHLERELLDAIDTVAITLHVGPGTFLPMEAPDVRAHRVGAERFEIDERAAGRIEAARVEGRPIVAVGTTVTRALESVVAQHGRVVSGASTTELVITPGFVFELVTHLMTNFHLPRSSLLMLVCSFAGRRRVLTAYEEAVAAGYRFYSYGDCMLVDRARAQGVP